MMLSTTQQSKKGHFLLILGQSGTGKSNLVKEIAHELLLDGKTTGIASLNVGGQTVHKGGSAFSLCIPPKKKPKVINLT